MEFVIQMELVYVTIIFTVQNANFHLNFNGKLSLVPLLVTHWLLLYQSNFFEGGLVVIVVVGVLFCLKKKPHYYEPIHQF